MNDRFGLFFNFLLRNNKLRTFLLFFFISFFLWIAFQLTRSYRYQIRVPVQYVNLPENYHQSLFLKDTLNLSVLATGFQLWKFKLQKPKVAIDVEKENLLKQKKWQPEAYKDLINEQIGRGLFIQSISPEFIFFKGKESFKKKVPIIPDVTIVFKQGFKNKQKPLFEPDSLWIFGPKKIIDTVQYVKTKPYTFKKVDHSVKRQLDLILPNHLIANHKKISLKLKVGEIVEGTFRLPISVINKPDKNGKLILLPEKTVVKFKTFKEDFSIVDKKDFLVQVDYNKRQHDKKGYYLQPYLVKFPTLVFEYEVHPKKVLYLIKKRND